MTARQKITPCLWFNFNAEEAVTHYLSIFKRGWLKDKFGLSWQIVPRALVTLLTDPDARKAARVMQAMMTMSKIDISRLQQAYGHP
jgi:predicted 3-demethylubiquinone-9 3-methyltransferase (glyoxalase superfamily)